MYHYVCHQIQKTVLEHAPSITITVNCDANAASLKVFTTVMVDGKYHFQSTKYEMFLSSLHCIGFPLFVSILLKRKVKMVKRKIESLTILSC